MKRRTFCATAAATLTATALPVHRLFAAQAQYDPTNLFRLNANVKPGA
jgi:Berberine and berberine like